MAEQTVEHTYETNLQNLTDHDLLQKTKTLAAQERTLLTAILHHLQEVERRRLFSTLGCSSLFTYAVQHLGYSEDQAYRRISAMRLLKTLPQLEEAIQEGAISLSSLAMAHSLFRKQDRTQAKLTAPQKIEILKKLEHKSARQAQIILLEHTPEPLKYHVERMRPVAQDLVEITVTISTATQAKLEKLKGLLAHKVPDITLSTLIDQLCDRAINELDPAHGKESTKSPATFKVKGDSTTKVTTENKKERGAHGLGAVKKSARHLIWKKAQGQCENCKSQHALQIDHIQPKALGGSNDPSNLRLLCRNCNQRAAVETLGVAKMERYWN